MNNNVVIGLEIHAQLKTNTKMFCGCRTSFGDKPNSNVCPVCMALPGSLPVSNKKAVTYTVMSGLALNCTISRYSKFDRKQYFYPDMPKNYQISQYDLPFCRNGYLEFFCDDELRKVRIHRIHLEEDTGKLIHTGDIMESEQSMVDYNRAGTPLMEIVTEPDISSPKEARLFMFELRNLLRYLDVSDGNMEEGSMRCDANISLKNPDGTLGTKVEIKNMNSLKSLEKALEFEINRQSHVISSGGIIIQETRHFDERDSTTHSLRTKEEAHDYRYFPEPDLLPVVITDEEVMSISCNLPELPLKKYFRFIEELGIGKNDASTLIFDLKLANFFDECVKCKCSPKEAVKWILGDLTYFWNEKKIEPDSNVFTPLYLKEILDLIDEKIISIRQAKEVVEKVFEMIESPRNIIEKLGIKQISDEGFLIDTAKRIVEENPKAVQDFLKGKKNAVGFLVGQLMRETKGKASPEMSNKIINEILNELSPKE
ncbi:Asp-tRNA(Asn)/Glu-tRNA(Gln) amidotransferase subunit GatB [Thermodesulfobium sp. 4217-1]|uniref:Asp-tRNA(Asn)/Glu-tRNA(Gln) amidotransferase subunit GatB n=1 Tax=Thermodesulfobium sp. 4217-1 TaxID=3120013 RepID=UPI0032215CE8